MKEKKRVLNDAIIASKVQLITDEWENLWEMSLAEARALAAEKELDLMEMSKTPDLTIIKMLDYGKFLYRQKKQDQKNKQKWKAPDLKTIRLTFKIWEHDLEIRRKQVEKFAKGHHPLKINLMLRGRENQYADLALEKIESFIASINELYKLEGQIKKSWNSFNAQLKPIK